jgi:hypothetical protein
MSVSDKIGCKSSSSIENYRHELDVVVRSPASPFGWFTPYGKGEMRLEVADNDNFADCL